ncbi:hypothetical protein LFWB_1200 [Candidatus Phytoplasma luffae]|uniref:Uncharacterized protein n=1 Tax=Loofah witches'-broom phytoplasma TaxID=35773 RepID=A0A975ILT3_LOWBP|nr:hypothetical protein LFWB_1200 [Candidatus Phytoplasma luffae]
MEKDSIKNIIKKNKKIILIIMFLTFIVLALSTYLCSIFFYNSSNDNVLDNNFVSSKKIFLIEINWKKKLKF